MENLAAKYSDLKRKIVTSRLITYAQIAIIIAVIVAVTQDMTVLVLPRLHIVARFFSISLLFVTAILVLARASIRKEDSFFILSTAFFLTFIAELTIQVVNVVNDFGIGGWNLSLPSWYHYLPFWILASLLTILSTYEYLERKYSGLIKARKTFIITFALAIFFVYNFLAVWYPSDSWNDFVYFPHINILFLTGAFIVNLLNGKWKNNVYFHWIIIALLFIIGSGVYMLKIQPDGGDLRSVVSALFAVIGYGSFLMGNFFSIFDLLRQGEIQSELAIRQSQRLEMFNQAVDSVKEAIVISNADGIVLYANPVVAEITGYSLAESLGSKAGTLWGRQMSKRYYEDMWNTIKVEKKAFISQITNKRKNGAIYNAEIVISPVLDNDDNIIYLVCIERDITKLKELERKKTEFISLSSQQLRSPLTTSKWHLEMLLRQEVGKINAKQRNYLQDVELSTERMIKSVNMLLNISNIDSGKIKVDPVNLDLVKLWKEVVKSLSKEIKAKNQQVAFKLGNKLPLISLDKELVKLVFINLLTNAVQYSNHKSEIVIELLVKGEYLITSVKDQGVGIPQDEQSNVFQRFYRGSNINTSNIDGTGLGLYLTKSIMYSLNGKVWFESQLNRGSTFWVAFPLEGSKASDGEELVAI